MTDDPFAPCPLDCKIPADIHRHYRRDFGIGNYFALTEPLPCCGREYMRPDEVLFLDQCEWCRQDGKPTPGVVSLVQTITPLRDAIQRRRR